MIEFPDNLITLPDEQVSAGTALETYTKAFCMVTNSREPIQIDGARRYIYRAHKKGLLPRELALRLTGYCDERHNEMKRQMDASVVNG